MRFLVSDVVHERVFEAVSGSQLFAEPEDALGLRILIPDLLADVVESARLTNVQVVKGRPFGFRRIWFGSRRHHDDAGFN